MKDPAFLFYSQDFYIGVSTLDWEERGKYITILCVMHQKGRMDEKTIRFLVGSVSDNLKEKFRVDDDGKWYNERLEAEIEKRGYFVESRRNNGLLGGRPKKNKPIAKPIGKAKNNLPENENENENENVIEDEKKVEKFPFERFWEIVAHKEGKDDTKAYWTGKRSLKNGTKMKDNDRERALAHYQEYIFNIEDLQYARRPKTYLYNSTFNDEIIINRKSTPKDTGRDFKGAADRLRELSFALERGGNVEPMDTATPGKKVSLADSGKIIEIPYRGD